MTPHHKPLFALALVLASGTSARAASEDELRSGKIISVEDRPYRLVHEFSVSGGILPTDARYVGVSIGGSYTLHLSEIWSWEAVSFHYSANIETNLDDELSRNFDVIPDPEPQLRYIMSSSLVFTPFLGKQSVFNKSITFQGAYLALGGGIVNLSGDDAEFFLPQIGFGPGIRFFISQVVSTKLDLRGYTTFDTIDGGLEIDFLLHAYLTVSFNFGRTRATEIGKDEAEDPLTGYEKLDELYPESNPDIIVIEKESSDED